MSRIAPVSAEQLLLRSVAEELKLPLLHIARQAELQQLSSKPLDFDHLQTSADTALMLIDCYLLGLELNERQTELELEPVSLSGVAYETAQSLAALARQYDVILECDQPARHGLVMAHAGGLKAALFSLAYALVRDTAVDSTGSQRITLGIHQCGQGIVAGVYGNFEPVANAQLKQARALYGRARQPFRAMLSGSGAGAFVADTIFRAMASGLRVSRHQRQTGLGAVLQSSKQLTLV